MSILHWEEQIINIKDVTRLGERTTDAKHIIRHQTGFNNLLVHSITIITLTNRQQTIHFTSFIFKSKHQMPVFCVTGVVH